MLNELWDGKREANDSENHHSCNKIVRFFDKRKFNLILEKDLYSKPLLTPLYHDDKTPFLHLKYDDLIKEP